MDWVARLPIAFACVGLALVTAAFARWAFGAREALYSGFVIATCIGLFLFTRILIPDVILTLTIALALWAFLRALEEGEPHPKVWAGVMAAAIGVGLLLKSLIGIVFPVGAALVFLFFTKQLFVARTWRRLRLFSGVLIVLLIAAPWHILATLRNPPYFVFTMRSVPGEYHGFFWFYFFNEQLLRFLNMRSPRDYDTVPRHLFWLFHLLWFFPWSVYLPAIFRLSFKPSLALDRAGKTRLLALCWIGFVMTFFTFSTTQEYYSMPIYPAVALLLGCGMAGGGAWIRSGTRVLCVVAGLAAAVVLGILYSVRGLPAPGDIAGALSSHPARLQAFARAYGRFDAGVVRLFASSAGGGGAGVSDRVFWDGAQLGPALERGRDRRAYLAAAVMMVVFFHAARLALVVFDPFMSSRPLANALLAAPPGRLVVNHHYYEFSSVFFYTGRRALLLNGRFNNLVYGSYAPDAPPVFIDDADFARRWHAAERYYFVVDKAGLARIEKKMPSGEFFLVKASGGKFLFSNRSAGD